ncbi:MAG: hypothetical protein WD066_19675 [Planctomycetaceae bacterium]
MQTRPTISVPRAVGIAAVGGGAVALSRVLGSPSDIALAIAGIAFGAVLLFAERCEFGAVAATFAGSMIGGFFGLLLLSDDFRSNVMVGAIGILVGATIASVRYHIRRIIKDESNRQADSDGAQHR